MSKFKIQKRSSASQEDPNVTVARFSFKQAIMVTVITGSTTLGGTVLTMNFTDTSQELVAQPCEEEIKPLREQLDRSISFSSLSKISRTNFDGKMTSEQVERTIQLITDKTKIYEEERTHFTGKLFRLKRLMLLNGGNINVRISSANQEACFLIQDLLRGIEYYKGGVDGNVTTTRAAVENFQKSLNRFTPDYFEEKNLGIVGKKTFNAILERYEKND
ncbi:MAG: peptidoglycan-binding domain-containing protein [Cyclobacteriaceae bacterium]